MDGTPNCDKPVSQVPWTVLPNALDWFPDWDGPDTRRLWKALPAGMDGTPTRDGLAPGPGWTGSAAVSSG